jgi:hypothetical protein
MATHFDPGDPGQRRFASFGLAEFPDVRDGDVDEFVRSLRTGGPPAVSKALATVSEKGRQVLRVYAERAAARAVRDRSRDMLVLGTIALIVGGLDQNALEALTRMPLIEDASKRLEIELSDVFEDVAAVVGHPGSVNLMVWLTRSPEDRTPECMGFAAAEDQAGFRYRWIA